MESTPRQSSKETRTRTKNEGGIKAKNPKQGSVIIKRANRGQKLRYKVNGNQDQKHLKIQGTSIKARNLSNLRHQRAKKIFFFNG